MLAGTVFSSKVSFMSASFPTRAIIGHDFSLIPYDYKKYFAQLAEFALDPRIWEQEFGGGVAPSSMADFGAFVAHRLHKRNEQLFVVKDNASYRIVGMTGVKWHDLASEKCEVGSTLIDPALWGRGANRYAKALMVDFLVVNGFERVQFEVDEVNVRSRQSLVRFGAVEEGVRRHSSIAPSGRRRNIHIFSVLADEWRDGLREKHSDVFEPREYSAFI